jgi:uncharacterized protein (DUF1697 family)
MSRFLSLFRGINVSGKNIIKMEALRSCMETAGFTDVKTYIQSGNVVFGAKERSAEKVTEKLWALVKKEFGHDITIITLTKQQLTAAIDENPFGTSREPESAGPKKLHLAFLSDKPAGENYEKLLSGPVSGDELELKDSILYIRFGEKQSESKLDNSLIESRLKVRSTMRNWNTVLKLDEMLRD